MIYRYDGSEVKQKFPWYPGQTAYVSTYRLALDGHTKVNIPPAKCMFAAGSMRHTHVKGIVRGNGVTHFLLLDPKGEPRWDTATQKCWQDFSDTYEEAVQTYNERIAQYIGELKNQIAVCVADTIPEDRNVVPAEFTSEWDDYETTIDSPCKVDTATRRIFGIDKENRTVTSSDDGIGPDNVDDAVDSLDEQTVTFRGETHPAVQFDEWDPADPNQYWYE